MKGERHDFESPADADLYEPLPLVTKQDLSATPFKAVVFDAAAPTVALATLTVTKNLTEDQIILEHPAASVTALLAAGSSSRKLGYRVYAGIGI